MTLIRKSSCNSICQLKKVTKCSKVSYFLDNCSTDFDKHNFWYKVRKKIV